MFEIIIIGQVLPKLAWGLKASDYVIYALVGSTPDNFLNIIGIEFNGPDPILKKDTKTISGDYF